MRARISKRRDGKPIAKIGPLSAPDAGEAERFGFMEGQLRAPTDFDRMGENEIEDIFTQMSNEFIETNPNVMGGTPVLRGTRMTVHSVLGRLEGGDSIDDILEDNPHLTRG